MTREQFAALRVLFNFVCAYCGTTETSVGAQLTVDHFQPTSRGGLDDESNWIYSCAACNTFKAAYWSAAHDGGLINPLRDDVSLHIEERNGVLVGLTPRGERHIERLHLNREQLIAQRQRNAAIVELAEELRQARASVERMERGMEEAGFKLD